jgi:hypothetical protein
VLWARGAYFYPRVGGEWAQVDLNHRPHPYQGCDGE